MHSRPASTMSDSFFTHGLPGIDLHYAELKRVQEPVTIRATMPLTAQARHLVATVFITAGNLLAGKDNTDPVCTSGNRLPA